jgi:O-antigen/teichoic acid export membrane protein
MYGFIYLFAEQIFTFVFGNKWTEAGQVASVLAPWLFLNFISSPLSPIFIIINKQEIMLIFSIIYMLVPISILYLFQQYNFINVIEIISITMSFLLVLLILFILNTTFRLKKGSN